jgi:hypothetical protein
MAGDRTLNSRSGMRIGAFFLARRHITRRAAYGLVIVAVVFCIYLIFLWTLPLPNTWVALDTTTEVVSFRAVNPNFATFRVSGMIAQTLDGKLNACSDAIVTPGNNVKVQYRRESEEFFRIIVGPAPLGEDTLTMREASDTAAKSLRDTVVFTANKECMGTSPRRLPIWGPAEFGEQLRPAGPSGEMGSGMMLGGTLEVYAHAQDRLFGFAFPSSVYSVMAFKLPPGAVLASDAPSADQSTWTGVAAISKDGTGFKVAATSNTPDVVLKSSRSFGPSASRRIDLGNFSQILHDPNVVSVQLFGGIFILLLQSVLSIVRFFTEGASNNSTDYDS